MSDLQQLEPTEVFYFFRELSKIPRGTFDTKKVSDYCVEFAKKRGLEVIQDEVNNVIIKKSGTPGYEASEPIIIQGHLDMVCAKTEDSTHDFLVDPLELYIEDGFLKAKNTTLGADDGIAIAYALAVLDSSDIPHPPIEALFTVDEEVGMGGAGKVDLSHIKGNLLLNIDSDNDGTIMAGCAGGFCQTISLPIKRESVSGTRIEVRIGGLQGGHSGIEIDQQRGNANKLAGRLLTKLTQHISFSLMEMNGGVKDNVIPSAAGFSIVTDDCEKAFSLIREMESIWHSEFGTDEPELEVTKEVSEVTEQMAIAAEDAKKVIFFLNCSPNGVNGFSRSLKGLVETSDNMGVVKTEEERVLFMILVRSSVASKLEEMREVLNQWTEMMGAEYEISGAYPAWMYKTESKLRPIVSDAYQQLYGREPAVMTVHAGLECGLLSGQRPELDCVSFGPNMYDIHSVKERLDIASTERTWEFLKRILKSCK